MIIKYGTYERMLIFLLEKKWNAVASTLTFFSKNTCELDNVLTRTLNILTTKKPVKLTMLWTTRPRCAAQGDHFANWGIEGPGTLPTLCAFSHWSGPQLPAYRINRCCRLCLGIVALTYCKGVQADLGTRCLHIHSSCFHARRIILFHSFLSDVSNNIRVKRVISFVAGKILRITWQ